MKTLKLQFVKKLHILNLLSLTLFISGSSGIAQTLKYSAVQKTRHKDEFKSYISNKGTVFNVGDTLRLNDKLENLSFRSLSLFASPSKIKGHNLVVTVISIYTTQDFIHTEGECEHSAILECKDLTTQKIQKIAVEKALENDEILYRSQPERLTIQENEKSVTNGNSAGRISKDAKVLNFQSSEPSGFVMDDIHNGYAYVSDGTQAALIDSIGNFSIAYGKYSEFGTAANGHIAAKENASKKWGLLNYRGDVVVPCSYTDKIFPLDEAGYFGIGNYAYGLGYFDNPSGKWQMGLDKYKEYRNIKGDGIKGGTYSYSYDFSDGLCRVSYSNGTQGVGFADRRGEIIIPIQKYEYYQGDQIGFSEGLAVVGKSNEVGEMKYGFIDTKGQVVIPFNYTNKPGKFKNGLSHVVSKSGEHAWIDKTGAIKMRSNDFPDWIFNTFDFDLPIIFVVRKDRTQRGWIDTNGVIKPFAPDKDKVEGLAGRAFYFQKVNRSFLLIRVSEYLDKEGSVEQLFHGKDSGKFGLLDKNGNIVIPPVFDYLQLPDPGSGLARAIYTTRTGNKLERIEGYVNLNGVFVIVKGKSIGEW
jgi:hypothetical protein